MIYPVLRRPSLNARCIRPRGGGCGLSKQHEEQQIVQQKSTEDEAVATAAQRTEPDAQQQPLPEEEQPVVQKSAEEEAAAAAQYTKTHALLAAVRVGDVLLLRGSWVLKRAGYEEGEEYFNEYTGDKKWVAVREAQPLPCRQEIEAHHPEAIFSADEIERIHTQSSDETLKEMYVPIVSISHCWETRDAPDPEARTLRTVAAALAGTWGAAGTWHEGPQTCLPYIKGCGFEDVGVFFDYSSLYQNKPVPRTIPQEASFKRALGGMSMWYCHFLTTVYIVLGQDPYLTTARHERGWPTYEEKMATVIKTRGIWWSKVVEVGGEAENESEDDEAEGGKMKFQPPMAPSAFASLLETLTFTNGSDREVVRNLYQQTMEDGFSNLTELRYECDWGGTNVGWGDAEVAQLSMTLREVNCAGVVSFYLTEASKLKSGEALAGIGQLKALEELHLLSCKSLTSLPDSIGQLKALRRLDLKGNVSLTSLPDSIGQLQALRELDLLGCKSLSSLPDSIGQLQALRKLDLTLCTSFSLSSLPEFSSLPQQAQLRVMVP